MTYRFIYSNTEANRMIPAVLLDSRGTISDIANVSGTAAKVFWESMVEYITDSSLLYRIETNNGNLVGYVILNATGGIVNQQLRPAFQMLNTEIMAQITNFISSNSWQYDIL